MPSLCSGLVFPGTLGGQGVGTQARQGPAAHVFCVGDGWVFVPPVTCIWGRGLKVFFRFRWLVSRWTVKVGSALSCTFESREGLTVARGGSSTDGGWILRREKRHGSQVYAGADYAGEAWELGARSGPSSSAFAEPFINVISKPQALRVRLGAGEARERLGGGQHGPRSEQTARRRVHM